MVGDNKLQAIPEVCYLRDMLFAGSWLQSHAAYFCEASSPNCSPLLYSVCGRRVMHKVQDMDLEIKQRKFLNISSF